MIDRMEAETQISEIQARRSVLFQDFRAASITETAFFEGLRRADTEERWWRARIAETENPAPEHLPAWGNQLWKVVETLRIDMDGWRDERRLDRVVDMRERDRARGIQYLVLAILFVWMAGLTVATAVIAYMHAIQ